MGSKERREREKEMRRREIQEAASHVFMLKGYNSATMEDIATRAELTPGAIYTYFKGKEELLASLLKIPLVHLYEHMKKAYDRQELPVQERMLGFKDAMYQTFVYDQLLLRNVFHFQVEDSLSTTSPEILAEINDLTRKMLNMMADVYQEGVSKGIFIEGNGMASADMLWGLFTGLVMWEDAKRKIDPRKDHLKSTFDSAFAVVVRGFTR
ncbi:MAG: TetR/AcrR family transcriptional regulator [Thermodesulfobacteriota bacterium]|nr:TetR/AcrR family transcriptional regulator [Thermodesulfobacteriota bacterium]